MAFTRKYNPAGVLVVCALLLAVVAAIAAVIGFVQIQLSRYQQEVYSTTLKLNRYSNSLRSMGNDAFRADPDGIYRLLQAKLAANQNEAVRPDWDKDAWGSRIVIMKTNPEHIEIYSCGPNGIDEKGKGDDIARSIAVFD
ncbi:hypothetical protein [Anatilimnocola floriformis]|uniref:hypothetical protein n=1 Tax=Anatilimnocola floriformis TaxID=2948575 RepID=UPI0020C4AF16|nr:hypothetical protein [Anatilimnocola floriformis]